MLRFFVAICAVEFGETFCISGNAFGSNSKSEKIVNASQHSNTQQRRKRSTIFFFNPVHFLISVTFFWSKTGKTASRFRSQHRPFQKRLMPISSQMMGRVLSTTPNNTCCEERKKSFIVKIKRPRRTWECSTVNRTSPSTVPMRGNESAPFFAVLFTPTPRGNDSSRKCEFRK